MIKIECFDVMGWDHAIRGMRNPLNSWDKSDSMWDDGGGYWEPYFEVGPKDLDLMKRLIKAGSDHRKFMRMITVYVDITAPLYWWKEFDTYKVGTVANSCSTMHKIADKEFELDDFSHEHILGEEFLGVDKGSLTLGGIPHQHLCYTIALLNGARNRYLETKDKKYWWQMVQLLPSSYNQKRTVMLNYEVLSNIYKSRKNHKLDEWHDLCRLIKALPYSDLITEQA